MELFRLGDGINLVDLAPPVPCFERFLGTYVLHAEKVALIDVGPSVSLKNLLSALAELKIKPEEIAYILSTHVHLDHTGSAGAAIKQMPNAKIIVHEKGITHLTKPDKLWEGSLKVMGEIAREWGRPEPVSESRLIVADEGMVIDLGGIRLEILLTPGHASHHLSYFDRENGKLFSGEAAGIYFSDTGFYQPASPPPFDLRQALLSLNKLIAICPHDIFYAHFGHSADATVHLQAAKKQIVSWGRVISHHLETSDMSEIIDEILTLDNTKAALYQQSPERFKSEQVFIQNNILGFLAYFQREGAKVMDELSLL